MILATLHQPPTGTESMILPHPALHPAPASPHVRLVGVSKQLGQLRAVDDVSLDIAKGSMVTLLGPSGCGKSTTLRLLAGFYRPSAGEIFLGDERITELPPNRRRMTMMFQEYALFPHLSVAGNVGYGLRMRKEPDHKIRSRVGEMLDLVGLGASAAKYPHQLSGGQQQRVALARALAVDPEVLLLDEPLSNLDAKLRVRLREEIVRLQKVLGKTMVFVTHDQEEALSISDQIAVMSEGRIVQLGSPTEIYVAPNSRYVAEFIGLANFIGVDVIAPGKARLGDAVLSVPAAVARGPATLMARPEAIRLVTGPVKGDAAIIAGTIQRRSFLGNMARYWIATPHGEWIVDDPAPDGRLHADDVSLSLAVERLHLLPSA